MWWEPFPDSPRDQLYLSWSPWAQGAAAHPLCPLPAGRVARGMVNLALGVLVAWLSIPVVLNLLSPRQVMNSSFNPLRIVNTYGAFGRYLRATETPGEMHICGQPLPAPPALPWPAQAGAPGGKAQP